MDQRKQFSPHFISTSSAKAACVNCPLDGVEYALEAAPSMCDGFGLRTKAWNRVTEHQWVEVRVRARRIAVREGERKKLLTVLQNKKSLVNLSKAGVCGGTLLATGNVHNSRSPWGSERRWARRFELSVPTPGQKSLLLSYTDKAPHRYFAPLVRLYLKSLQREIAEGELTGRPSPERKPPCFRLDLRLRPAL